MEPITLDPVLSQVLVPGGGALAHRTPFRLALVGLLTAPLASCVSTGDPISELADEINATLTMGTTVLAPGDQLQISFTQMPPEQWDQEIQVRPDGYASFKGLDDVLVAGLTVEQLDEKLEEYYGRTLQTPDLTVNVAQLAARYVTVWGEVNDGGAQELNSGRRTLVEAIGIAGGHSLSRAKLGHTVLVRWDAKEGRQRQWLIDASEEEWGSPTPILLQPYDLVFVSSKTIVKVDTWVSQYIRQLIPFPQIFLI